ncbi:MAG: M20/M25/M40 family metallo-hydrolase [Actinobacteria bacterium]|nr:M20/M25/M40 family metallo-hydrolase [Actinomycetota bacterium]
MASHGLETDDWNALEREVVELFTALLRIDTTNPPGNETACALVIKDYLASNGIESTLVGELPHRQNLVARLEGARRGPTLTYMGHTDVVPSDAAEWSVPPFGGVVKDAYVWGCGATDMKNQVAAEAVALARLKRSGADFAGTVKYAATADEEVGDHCGVRWLCQNEPDALRSEYLINEGMGGLWLPVNGQRVFLLATAEKAFAQFRIRTRGRGGHASVPEKERSAVIDLARAVVALGLYDSPPIIAPFTAQFIDAVVGDAGLRARLKDARTARVAGAELRGLDAHVAALVEPLLGATFTPTLLDAGKAVNVIPTHAEACIDCRILPEMTTADTRALVAAVLDPLGIDWEFEWVDVTTPNASPAPTALSESIARVLRRDVPDAVLAPMCSGSFTDSRWVREYFPDCIAYGFAPFVAESLHAMEGGRDHEPDERIRVEDVTYQALFFERLARDLLA